MKCKIFIFLSVIGFISCKKYGEGYVEGTVYEVGTNMPIAGIPVTIGYFTGPSTPYVTVSNSHTDNSGHYLLYYDKKRGSENYVVGCTPDSLHLSGNTGSYDPEYKKETNGNIPLYPRAFLKLHVKKTTSAQYNNGFQISVSYLSGGLLYYYYQTFLNNNPFDTILPVFKAYGNCTNYIFCPTTGSSIGSTFINKGDTGVFTIQYQ